MPKRMAPRLSLTTFQQEALTGVLLGDGCIATRSGRNARLQYTSKDAAVVQLVADVFSTCGMRVPYPRREYAAPGHWTARCAQQFSTYSAANLLWSAERRLWYPHGVKVVPHEVALTPTSLLYWYLGDGNLARSSYGNRVNFSTHGFSVDDVELLRQRLYLLGFHARAYKDGGSLRLYVLKEYTQAVLDYMEPAWPVGVMEYKRSA